MELPIYFNVKEFEKNYLKDFKHLKNEDSSLKIIDYYKEIYDTYFNIHADLNSIYLTNNDIADHLFATFQKEDEFLYLLHDMFFEEIIKKLEEHNIKKRNYTLRPDIMKEIITENIEIIGGRIDYVAQEIIEFILNEIFKIEFHGSNKKVSKGKAYTNPQRLALLQELEFFDLPVFKNLPETKVNEITGLILDADPKEFVYKNRLNLKSKDPDYQTDKYTAFQYLEEMKRLISTTD